MQGKGESKITMGFCNNGKRVKESLICVNYPDWDSISVTRSLFLLTQDSCECTIMHICSFFQIEVDSPTSFQNFCPEGKASVRRL